jgi:hypothetical protein
MQPVLFFIDIEVGLVRGHGACCRCRQHDASRARRSCLAQQHKTCEAGIMLVTTAGMLVVLPATFEAASTSRWRTML